ncbi:MAG: hypothetical protein MJZ39_04200 [Bacteroidales bacterium]|nr:hypothetical protein [Bacteroidales bacterium]
MSYFGARYYSSDLSVWLSVDPMSDKYPSMSPYTYCANNPVKLVDPNGEDYEVVVDDKAMTITIKATYYTFADNKERVLEGIQAWNNESGNYEYTTDDGQTYTVNFELTVKTSKTTGDTPGSRGAWNWVRTAGLLEKGRRGESNGYEVVLDYDQVVAPTRTTIHEIGHTLGIADDKYGVMESGGTSDIILDEHIMTVLRGSGINATNGSSGNTINTTPSKAEIHCETKYNMNGNLRRKNL